MKPILCLDFDGVIHSYTSGWQGVAVITDPPVPGAMEFIAKAADHFKVAVYSSRSGNVAGRKAMWHYIGVHLEGALGSDKARAILAGIDFPSEKPPAFISIDDRAITFEGLWPEIEALLAFKPWNKRPPAEKPQRTVLDILKMANDRGEIGYAHESARSPSKPESDWPLVREAVSLGLIIWAADRSVGGRHSAEGGPYQRRDIYALTRKGHAYVLEHTNKKEST